MNSPASLVDELMAQLQGAPLQQMAQQLGTSPEQAEGAVGAALPLLLGTLGRNAAQPQGAMDLFGALQRDHSGGPDLGGLLGSLLGGGGDAGSGAGGGGQPDGAAILGHIFGGNQQRAEADDARAEFTLTGSDRPADVAAAAGQQDIFSAAPPPAPSRGPAASEAWVNEGKTPAELDVMIAAAQRATA